MYAENDAIRRDRQLKRIKRPGKIYHWSYYHDATDFDEAANYYSEHVVLPPFTESYAECRYYDTSETTGEYPVYLSSNFYYPIRWNSY